MTCHNYPEVARAALGNNKRTLLVWALDNGAAGERAMKKFVARSHDDGWKATAARPAEKECGNDWNDLHMKGKLTERDIARYRYYGKLLLASTAFEKARLMFNWTERSEIEFLWRLCGRADYEGFDASKSSVAARGRNFSQISNLPVCLIESDRVQDNAKLKAFDWEELKSLYNGRATRSLGVKNSGNETYEPLFKGSIVIAQNAEINASRAVLERIIHLYTDKAEQGVETRYAAIALERYPIERLSGFLPTVLMKEAAILKQYNERVDGLQAQLFADKAINHERIAKNHAQLIALLETLALVLPVKATHIRQTRDFIIELAKQRVQAIQLDQPQVMEFWELFDYLHDNEAFGVNHSSEKGVYAVNFNHIAQVASEYRQSMQLNTDIKNLLKAGRMRKFVGVKTVRSVVNSQFNSTLAVGEYA